MKTSELSFEALELLKKLNLDPNLLTKKIKEKKPKKVFTPHNFKKLIKTHCLNCGYEERQFYLNREVRECSWEGTPCKPFPEDEAVRVTHHETNLCGHCESAVDRMSEEEVRRRLKEVYSFGNMNTIRSRSNWHNVNKEVL